MLTDEKMLQLLEALQAKEIIRFSQEFCDAIGILPANLYRIKTKKAHFTPEHIRQAILIYGVNPYWIFGIEDNMFKHGFNAYWIRQTEKERQ